MVKKIVVICLVFLLACLITTSVFAFNIKIKSIPDHRISLIIRESGKLSSLESFHQETGTGELTITSAVTADPLDIIVTLKKDGANIINRKYESVKNENLFLIFIPGDDKLMTQAEADAELTKGTTTETTQGAETTTTTEKEATEENKKTTNEAEPANTEETTQAAETETNDKLTTFALLDKLPVDNSLLVKIGIGLLLVIGAIVMIRVMPALKKEGTFTIKPLAKLKEEMSKTHVDKKVEEIERKMKGLQSELDYVKNRDGRMKEIQDRMKKDQEELRRLQQGY